VEAQPYFNNEKLRIHHAKRGVAMTGYGPLGAAGENVDGSKVDGFTPLKHPVVVKIAEKYNKAPGQILLKFQVQRNVATFPKSVTPARIKSNIDIFDFEMDQSELDELLALGNANLRAYPFSRAASVGPKYGPQFVFKQ